jgi:3-dehydroshikimate dehydratase
VLLLWPQKTEDTAVELDRISACNYPVRTEPLETTLTLIAGAGYRKVDLWGGLPNYSNDPAECDVQALKKTAAAHGLTIANLGTYPGRTLLEQGEDAEWIELTRAVDNAAFLGSRSIRVCPGKGEDPSIIPDLIPFFTKAAAYAAEKNVFLGMENHKGNIAGNPDAIMKLVRAVDSPMFGILYEPANLMHCKVDYRDAFDAFKGHITHVHVKDSHWTGDTYERTMLGEGDIDYNWVVGNLEESGYTGDYALEFEIEKVLPVAEGLPQWLDIFRAIQP